MEHATGGGAQGLASKVTGPPRADTHLVGRLFLYKPQILWPEDELAKALAALLLLLAWLAGNGAAFKVLGEDADGPILSAPIPMLLQKFTVGLQLGGCLGGMG